MSEVSEEVQTGTSLPRSEGGAGGRRPKKSRQARTPAAAERTLRGARHDHPPSGCRSPGGRSLLLPYALSACSEREAISFEAHLLACEACFQDLKSLDRAGSLIREFSDSATPAAEHLRLVLSNKCSQERSASESGHNPPGAHGSDSTARSG